MKQRVFFAAMSVVVAVVVSAAVPIAIGAPQEQAIVVTSTADSGPGTLREALQRASPGATITFDPAIFPQGSPATIAVISPLPQLAQGDVTIDGSDASVILDGSQLPREGPSPGLVITSSGNVIRGLRILHFAGSGVTIVGGAQNNVIGGTTPGERNVISGNWDGVIIAGSGTMYNTIIGNYIGTDATGTAAIGNVADGVWIGEGAQHNVVGGPTAAERNLISGNGNNGVVIDRSMNNTVIGNYIGTDVTGTKALGNSNDGVVLAWGAQYNLIGGDTAGERNVISGNGWDGVWLGDSGTMDNTVSGNYIGTNASGTAAIPNGNSGVNLGNSSQNNLIGGSSPAEGNLISGNGKEGVTIAGSGVMDNIVTGNYVGTDATGTAAIGNTGHGIAIGDGAQNNRVGGATPGEGNLISGNSGDGVNIAGPETVHNLVVGNYIGLDVSGTEALPNSHGVSIVDRASHNTVQGNVISGHQENPNIVLWDLGTVFNLIIGNLIGTDASGTVAIPSAGGVAIRGGASDNRIGGSAPGEGNLISGNRGHGIDISWGSARNQVVGNLIGTDTTGTFAIPNGMGILIRDAPGNIIGGRVEGEGNVISANEGVGVAISGAESVQNEVLGNYIGTDLSGTVTFGNLGAGVVIDEGATRNIIGPANVIAYNGEAGVRAQGSDTLGNTITANSIYDNEGLGIENSEGGNAELSAPVIIHVSSRSIRGTALSSSIVEIFSDKEDEGRVFEGSTAADEKGNFAFRMPVGRFTGPNVTATATDAEGNTSGFSPPESPPAPVVTRELPDIVAPTQVSVEPKVVGTNLGLALFCVLFFGLTSTVFNSILVDYREELVVTLGRLIPRSLAGALHRVGLSFRGMVKKGRGRLLLMWLMVLLVTSLIESFLDPEVGVLSPERMGIVITLFISGIVVSGLELGSGLYARRRLAPRMRAESKVQWIGMAIAVGCVILSRALDFKPGYLYGIVGAIYLMPDLADITSSGKRAVFVLLTVFAGGFILWIATAFLPATLAELEPLFLTIFLVSLQGVFFALFPLALADGGDIWSWRRGVWFVFFSIVFFCFYHFVLNPNASDVQALQQNGVQTLLHLILVFGLATFALWLLFPFRLGRKRASQS